MKLHIAGINHYDPLGRQTLRGWLRTLKARYSGNPAFVAVEFDEHQFDRLKGHRTRFRDMIRKEWPDVPNVDLDVLECSLAYEGDSHHEYFSNAEVLWLDSGRRIDPFIVDRHPDLRLRALKYLSETNALLLIGVLSEQFQSLARRDAVNTERSQLFAERILKRIEKNGSSWAIVIAGASHTSDAVEGSMRWTLESLGIQCDVDYMCTV